MRTILCIKYQKEALCVIMMGVRLLMEVDQSYTTRDVCYDWCFILQFQGQHYVMMFILTILRSYIIYYCSPQSVFNMRFVNKHNRLCASYFVFDCC